MEKILQKIEERYAPQMQEAQDALSTAQMTFDNLVGSMEEEKRKVREYFGALAQKEQAEMIIAGTDIDIKTEVALSEEVIK